MNNTKPKNAYQKVRILIAEDHELARYGLVLALEDHNFEIVADVENGRLAADAAYEYLPALILMDIGMPVLDGISATKEIKAKHPEIRIIVLTSHREDEEVYAALGAGADAYCMKDIKIERLCQVIDMVLEGVLWIDPATARIVLSALPGAEGTTTSNQPGQQGGNTPRKRYNTALTEREHEVLKLIVAGKSNKEIALSLGVTAHTAKAHVCNIIQKLAVDDRTQVAVKALQEGLISPS